MGKWNCGIVKGKFCKSLLSYKHGVIKSLTAVRWRVWKTLVKKVKICLMIMIMIFDWNESELKKNLNILANVSRFSTTNNYKDWFYCTLKLRHVFPYCCKNQPCIPSIKYFSSIWPDKRAFSLLNIFVFIIDGITQKRKRKYI